MRVTQTIPAVSSANIGRRNVMLGGAAVLASGCSPLQGLQTATKAPELYTLSSKNTFEADLPRIDAQIVVDEPTAAAAVNTDRIAVRPHPLKVEYFPGVRWVDRAPLMIRVLLMESYENTGQVLSVGPRASGLSADFTVLIDLREFQAETEAVTNSAAAPLATGQEPRLTINVRFTMKVVSEPAGLIVGSQSFAAQVEAASQDMLDVATAFDQALGKCIRRSVSWSMQVIDRLE